MNPIETEIFTAAKPDRKALETFGFEARGDKLFFSGSIVDGDFFVNDGQRAHFRRLNFGAS